jgi:hypothetical protein
MAQIKTAGAVSPYPTNQPSRGRTGRLAQATRTTAQGNSAATAAKASLSKRRVR